MAKNYEHFKDFNLNKQLLNAIDEAGYSIPTPIQKQAIPIISAGHDIIGIAQTGTGKTAAYMLPALMKVKYAQGDIPRALILAPTRELVIQIEEEAVKFARYTDIRITALYGGVGLPPQIKMLNEGIDIVVATPGRCLDLYRKGALLTKAINTLVLDEADKMMDMGFMPQIRDILEKIPVKRQNMLFSATFSDKVELLSSEFLDFPEKVAVTPQATVTEQVKQGYYQTPNFKTKINLLAHLLQNPAFSRVLVFVKTKAVANNVFKFIHRKIDKEVKVIHSNKAQQTRINAIKAFKSGEVRVLVSTDISARGHDINQVSHVINFDVPVVYEDYVHRIGRTGRATAKGDALTFANDAELLHLLQIEKLIKEPIEKMNLPESVEIAETDPNEKKHIERSIDAFRRHHEPDYQGAFHEKKDVQNRQKNRRFKNNRKRRR